MRPKKHETTGEGDLFRARLDQIINMEHELVELAGRLDWSTSTNSSSALQRQGRPGLRRGTRPKGIPKNEIAKFRVLKPENVAISKTACSPENDSQ